MLLYFSNMLLLFTFMSTVRYLNLSESLIYPVNIGYLIIQACHSNEIQTKQKIEPFFFTWWKHIININIIYINRIFRIIQNLLLDFIFFQITSIHLHVYFSHLKQTVFIKFTALYLLIPPK